MCRNVALRARRPHPVVVVDKIMLGAWPKMPTPTFSQSRWRISSQQKFSVVDLWIRVPVWCVSYICGWCYRHVAPLWETVQFPGVVSHHRGSGLCGVCPIYVVGVTDMSLPSERQFSSLELSAIIVVAVCVVCVLYLWLVLQTCRAPLRDSSVPWSCRPSSW